MLLKQSVRVCSAYVMRAYVMRVCSACVLSSACVRVCVCSAQRVWTARARVCARVRVRVCYYSMLSVAQGGPLAHARPLCVCI